MSGTEGKPEEKPTEDPPPQYQPTSHAAESQPLSSEPPPPYNSLFGQIRDAGKTSAGTPDMIKKLCALTLCSTAMVILMTVLLIGLPIAMIVIGALHLNDCPIQRLIPIYLIVGGSFALFRGLGNFGNHVKKKRSEGGGEDVPRSSRGADCCGFIIDLFMGIWFICGCVWVYSVHKTYQSVDPNDKATYCHQTLYLFSFWLLTSSFILMALAITCGCCVLCVACCAQR